MMGVLAGIIDAMPHPSEQLPGRRDVVQQIDQFLVDGDLPGVFTVAVDGYAELAVRNDPNAQRAILEVAMRLKRVIRDTDVFALLGPGVFALVGHAIEPMDASVIRERIQAGFALPVDFGDSAVSFPVTVGAAYAVAGSTGEKLLTEAESDLRRHQR